MAKAKGAHYVDNKKFHQAMIEWKEKCRDAEEAGDDIPQISDYIGACFLKIANGLSYSRLINGLKIANIEMDRRVLADLAMNEKLAFEALAKQAKQALEQADV